jgi:hypothetical protein
MLTGERARWGSNNPRSMGKDHIVQELSGLYQLVVGAAALVDGVEDSLVPGCDRFLAVVVLSSNIDEVSVGAEGFAKRSAVGLVPDDRLVH